MKTKEDKETKITISKSTIDGLDEQKTFINGEIATIEYTASLLEQLKMIADQSGHRMLYHLINMAEMEATYILKQKEKNTISNETD